MATMAREGRGGFRELVEGSPEVSAALAGAGAGVDPLFDVSVYLGGVDETFRRLGLALDAPAPARAVVDRPALAVEAGLGGGQA